MLSSILGLGRYGDPLDPMADLKAINELKRILSPNGDILFVVPVGKVKIMFNAHRIYSKQQILDLFEGFSIQEFVLIPESDNEGGILIDPSKETL
jgi:hypothetical protein